jgi:S-adenosylmethionine/arginine decarboxylase-like enzyme
MIVPWGIHTLIDLSECDNELIRSKKHIENYANELVKLIDMKSYGDPIVVHFGSHSAEGYTLVQMIETSLISGHFCNVTNEAYIDIFSCKEYDVEKAADFTMGFFGASHLDSKYIKRGCMFEIFEDN